MLGLVLRRPRERLRFNLRKVEHMAIASLIISAIAICISIFAALVSWLNFRDSSYRLDVRANWSWRSSSERSSSEPELVVSLINRGGRDIQIRKIGFSSAERDAEFMGAPIRRRVHGSLKAFQPPVYIKSKSGEQFFVTSGDKVLAGELDAKTAFIWVEDGMFNRYEIHLG